MNVSAKATAFDGLVYSFIQEVPVDYILEMLDMDDITRYVIRNNDDIIKEVVDAVPAERILDYVDDYAIREYAEGIS